MHSVKIDIDADLAALLHETNQPVEQAAREMIVLELYRRGAISSGKPVRSLAPLGLPSFNSPRASAFPSST